MQPKSATLVFKPSKNCFVTIPNSWCGNTTKDEVWTLKVENGTSVLYAAWLGDTTPNRAACDTIEINGLFAAKQGFKDGQVVCITRVTKVPVCTVVHVEPASVDDWEILEMNASEIESSLLSQLRTVASDHVFPIWVHKTVCIFIQIGSMQPVNECCLLQANTQVIVAPKSRHYSGVSVPMAQSHKLHNDCDVKSNNEAIDGTGVDNHTPAQNEATDNSGLSVPGRAAKWIGSLWYGEQLPESSVNVPAVCRTEIWSGPHRPTSVCRCRILPLEEFTFLVASRSNKQISSTDSDETVVDEAAEWPALEQPLNVYVGLKTVAKGFSFYSHSKIPVTFLAVLRGLASPSDRLAAAKEKERSGKTVADVSAKISGDSSVGTSTIVRVVILNLNAQIAAQTDVFLQQDLPQEHVLISPMLRRQLSLSVKSRVTIEPLMTAYDCLPSEVLCYPLCSAPDGFSEDMLQQAVMHWFKKVSLAKFPTVISNGTVIRSRVTHECAMELAISFGSIDTTNVDDNRIHYCLVGPEFLDSTALKIRKQLTIPALGTSQPDVALPLVTLERFKHTADNVVEATDHIDVSLCTGLLAKHVIGQSGGTQAGCLVVCGIHGSGKTTFCQALCHYAASSPHHAYIQTVDCKQLHGKKPESIGDKIRAVYNDAVWYQPSVIVLDDLDQIAAACSGPDQEMAPETLYHARVAQEIRMILKSGADNANSVCVIVTCRSRNSLHQILLSTRGQHFCSRVVEMKSPNYTERTKLLKDMLAERKSAVTVSYEERLLNNVAKKTEGFAARDLKAVADRAFYAHLINNQQHISSKQIVLTDQDFQWALKGFTPSVLLSVPLLPPGDLTWNDVGGLQDVRQVLQQTLLWPSKYPKLFSSCPLRLRSGLLLYGAPGTGKTLLAGVVAKEFSLNFISIKGPELLNKYIGASESAVRETFARAQSARPCVLFFDEFDSLAPRRGHDSTGVTDRVVNQLLTQLDGVEKLEGVFVLAATSRPDLIDPALLRPGRLDKALHCPLPSENDRFDILQALSRNMNLSSDVDLRSLAAMCEHFTGADIKALLYNAQLNALDSDPVFAGISGGVFYDTVKEQSEFTDITYIPSLDKGPVELDRALYEQLSQQVASCLSANEDNCGSRVEKVVPTIVVTHQHLLAAVRGTRPSVSATERHKYDLIYQSFVASRAGDFSDDVQEVGNRVTLA